jgi:hypothetical protein
MFVRSWMVPVVLAGLRSEERMLIGHREDPSSILRPDNKREWCNRLPDYQTRNQPFGLHCKPLCGLFPGSSSIEYISVLNLREIGTVQ